MPRQGKPQTADEAMRERHRLQRYYIKSRNEYRHQIYKTPGGEQLQEFAKQLERYGAGDASAMLRYVRESARGWLATAEPQLRPEALSLCNERIIAIRTRGGRHPFSDPLPEDGKDDH